ncbi:MAG: ABC-2 transporter permease [Ruminococcus sp.]|nr:ABC-2 transporter permease [Ruminococcus sp.]
MTGLVYKEWKQNRFFILMMIACGLLPFVMILYNREIVTNAEEMGNFRTICTVIAFLAAGGIQTMVLNGDDRKIWGYWITAAPEGYRGFIRVKYEMVFAMIVLFVTSLRMFDELFCAAAADKGWELTGSMSTFAIPLAFLQMLLRATDIPFTLRYGNKKGGIIKLIFSVLFVIIISVLVLTNAGNIDVILFETGEKLFTEDNLSLALGILCVIAPAAYYISYRISCRVYLKGVEQYDK